MTSIDERKNYMIQYESVYGNLIIREFHIIIQTTELENCI